MRGWFVFILTVSATTTAAAQTAPPVPPNSRLTLAAHVSPLPTDRMGPFLRTGDGAILTVDGKACVRSTDEGRTWSAQQVILPESHQISNERVLVRKPNGVIVLAYMNLLERSKNYWDEAKLDFPDDINLPVYTVRSTDDGQTWETPVKVQDGYSGAMRGMTVAADGTLVLASQNIARNPARHVTTVYTSKDDGKTWQAGAYVDAAGKRHAFFDLGGHGHHDGAIEPTLIPLTDGRLWMLIRSGKDWFWETFSADSGATWTDFRRSKIEAAAAPGLLHRLADGRWLLCWNRLYPEGKSDYPRKGPPWHAVPACYHREELSIAVSGDEGQTWSAPQIVARHNREGGWVSYPYLFEVQPGTIWLTTMQGGLRAQLHVGDFFPAK